MSIGFPKQQLLSGVLAATAVLLTGTGCKKLQDTFRPAPATQSPAAQTTPGQTPATPAASTAGRTDAEISTDVQNRIIAESALNGQNIQVSVNNGMATLNGSVDSAAARALASNDAGAVDGVRTVINNLTVAAPATTQAAAAPPPRMRAREERSTSRRQSAPRRTPAQDGSAMAAPPQSAAPASAPVQNTQPAPPPPPPQPVAKTVTIPSGTTLPVRITETLDSATTQPGQSFHGTLANDLVSDGMLAIPRGASVSGRVIDAKDATHFSGSALLSVEVTSISAGGRQIPVVTSSYVQQGKGRGKNTAAKAGGGAAVGAIIGALAGGGRGAAIGAASGGALGGGVNAVTRGQQVLIPSETLINFQLQSPVNVTTSRSASQSYDDNSDNNAPQLHPR